MIILNQYEVGGHDFLLLLSIVAAIVVVAIGIFVVLDRCTYGTWDRDTILYFIGAIIGFGFYFGAWLIPENDSHMVYEVYFAEDVSLQEFLEKYEIVSQDGDIYTIKQKE